MKKYIFAIFLFLITFTGITLTGHVQAAGSTTDFTIPDYQIDYTLGRDSSGHSTLKTVENIDALFPSFDQNHGIERYIPTTYQNHPVGLHIDSVKDNTGKTLKYSTYSSNGNTVLRIGDANVYVHGLVHYVITYSQRDVTGYFANTNDDEFYWDTNGTGWSEPIYNLSVNLHMDKPLLQARTGKQACYSGNYGSDHPCGITSTADGYSLKVPLLSPQQNATIAIGFKPHTFATYQPSLVDMVIRIWQYVLIGTGLVSLLLVFWFIPRYNRQSNRSAEHTTIVPEYTPPPDTSVSASAAIYRIATSSISAQLIDYAVRGYLKIYQIQEKSFLRKAEYELEITKDISDLKAEEQELITDLFPATAVGTRLALADLKRQSTSVYLKLQDNPGKLSRDIKGSYALRAGDQAQSRWFYHAAIWCLVAGVLTLSPLLAIAAFTAFLCGLLLCPLTDKGLALYHYLEGLKMYIKVAEQDRIRMLQAPDTAEKIGAPVDTNDQRQMIKLYERVLPYAMLFGLERQWNNQLGRYYENLNTAPVWYSGNNTIFNAAILSSTLGSFNTAVTYSAPTSSSAGGTGGGGFSGGGGGGGGGGGW